MANQKVCECGATVFQGPFYEGPIISGKMDRQRVIYRCLGCNLQHDKTDTEARWVDRPVPTPIEPDEPVSV